jgi:pyruvyltransferase
VIPLYWHVSTNFGDALAPYLVKAITGQEAEFRLPGRRTHLVTGSILSRSVRRGFVWGAGAAFKGDLHGLPKAQKGLRVLAVRGRLSNQVVENLGHETRAIGDPAWLLPRFCTPRHVPVRDVRIICSWVDRDDVIEKYGEDVVINSDAPVQEVVDAICASHHVVSSTLHGLLTAAAYGRPTRWVEFSDRMMGDGFKYRDALTTTKIGIYPPVDLRSETLSEDDLMALTTPHEPTIDLDALMSCCPFA